MNKPRALGRLILVLVCVAPPLPSPILWAGSDAGQYGSDVGAEDESKDEDPQYHGAKEVSEQEGRQKDLGKWVSDVELLNQNKVNAAPESAPAPKESPRTPGYLDTVNPAGAQRGFLQGQEETQGDVDEEQAFQQQAQGSIQEDIQAARRVAKAGNSISFRSDGAEFMSYHGLLMGVKNQHFGDGLGQDTIVNMYNIHYDFSTRLMLGYTRVSTDPRGNVSMEQRLDTTYTSDSSGLPDHMQRVTGFTEVDTNPGGIMTETIRSNGQYNDQNNPGYNNINFGGQMITSYDQSTFSYGEPSVGTKTQFRDGVYDANGNPMSYTQTTIHPTGEMDVVQRLNTSYQLNPQYIDQNTQHIIQVNYTMPKYQTTGYDQYAADYVNFNGNTIYLNNTPPEIQHETDMTYNDSGLLTGSYMVATLPDDQTILSATDYSVSSFDEWGNPLTWRNIQTNEMGVLSVTDELATQYDQMNHVTYAATHTLSTDGTDSTNVTEMTYDEHGLLATESYQTDSNTTLDEEDLIQMEQELGSETRPGFPYGIGTMPTFSGDF